jgi:hypothetical protein
MARTIEGWERRGERFWRAHHEAWKRSSLNQREYCEAQRIPQKAFENWRQIFRREPQAPSPKLLYRRGGLNHTLSHTLSHVAYSTLPIAVPPARDGRRRRFSPLDRQRLIAEAKQPGSSLSEVARRHGLDRRMLMRWKQDLAGAKAPGFVQVVVSDGAAP